MQLRNRRVHAYRQRLLKAVHTAALLDMELGKDYLWRFKVFESVKYEHIVLQFWRKLDSFYPDKAFIEPLAQSPKTAASKDPLKLPMSNL